MSHRLAARRLDLDHVGTKIGEDECGVRPGDVLAQVEDAHALEKTLDHAAPAWGEEAPARRRTLFDECRRAPASGCGRLLAGANLRRVFERQCLTLEPHLDNSALSELAEQELVGDASFDVLLD